MTTAITRQRRDLSQVPRYATARVAPPLDLSDNTNRWGSPPAVERALREFRTTQLARYPDAYAEELKEAIACYCDVPTARISTGCGSDDVLDSALRAFAVPGDRVVSAAPSFVMVPQFCALNSLEFSGVPLLASWDIDAEALVERDASVIYLCAPNNPTGTAASRDALGYVVDNARGVVIIDEAYAEFAEDDCLDLARTRANVLVVRTMSKAFGLAGLRVGYAIGDAALIDALERSRGPFKVSAVGAAGAAAALVDGVPWMKAHVRVAREARTFLSEELRARGIVVAPSQANFVFAPLAGAAPIRAAMFELGVGVRAFVNPHGLRASALRITVGPPDEMARVLAVLDAARAQCA